MEPSLPRRDVVLLGAGHTNAHVLRRWRMSPIPDVRLTCVSNFSVATYSGMLPGVLAGLYEPERMEIDLVRLCVAAGVRFIRASVTGLDVDGRQLLVDDRPPIPFDVLSIGIGSLPDMSALDRCQPDENCAVLPIKPMQTFLARLERRLAALRERAATGTLRVVIVGAGAGGVEIAFCLPSRLRSFFGKDCFSLTIIDRDKRILAGMRPATSELAERRLRQRGVELLLGQSVIRAEGQSVDLGSGQQREFDLIVWVTQARPPDTLASLGLPTDERGFLLTRATLQTTADAPIFAVGDAGTIHGAATPKAGVYAVRQGPVLWDNIGRLLRGEPLSQYTPQRGFLSLLATGDERAILTWKRITTDGGWCWRLKDYIDSRFMAMYQDYRPMEPNAPGETSATRAEAMRCLGCGGKVGGRVLANVLARLDLPPSPHVSLGLDAPDDAAVVQVPGGRPVVATVDFFTAFLDDPYLVGRIAAVHAASDAFALGAKPLAALALATLPVGPERQQEQLLYELLSGGLREFRAMGATLAGGHTTEGSQTTIGYTVLADLGEHPPRTKAGLRAGDLLVLTKPLGIGVLLAAHMRAACRAGWMDRLIETMLAGNQHAAELAEALEINGMTDVTGFGLAGHLLEMLRASNVAAELRLNEIPALTGALELLDAGIESTLAPANRAAETEIEATDALRTSARYRLLFDPQSSGGMLLGVPEQQVDAVVARLGDASDVRPAVIGRVAAPREGRRIHLT